MDALNESEKRFLAAVDRLSKAAAQTQEHKARAQKVEAENKILAGGLAQLKADYQALEKAFGDLKTHVETRELTNPAPEGTSEAEVAALKDQLSALQNDYNAMEEDFSNVKRQYAETLETAETAPLLPFGAKQNVDTSKADEKGMDEFRDALRARLDTAISRLERISA